MQLIEITPPATEPLTLEELKLALKLEHEDDDTHLENCLKAARLTLEKRLDMAFMQRDCRLTLDQWSTKIVMPVSPVSTVTAINVTNADLTQTLIPATLYLLANDRLMFYAYPIDPGIKFAGITIDFTAGFAEIPPDLKQAVMMLAIHFYENRGVIGSHAILPENIAILISPYKKVRL